MRAPKPIAPPEPDTAVKIAWQWCASRLARAAGFVALLVVVLGLAVPVPAARAAERKNFVLSETIGKRLLRVAELAEEEKYAEAVEILEPLTQKSRLKKYDRAQIFQTYGLMLAAVERYADATQALETALAIDYLPDTSMQSLKYNLAQLYMAEENFPRAIELLEDWMRNEESPNAQAEFLIAAAYAQTDDWDKALPHARRSVELSDEPVEQRLRMLLAVEFTLDHAEESQKVLKELVTYFPQKTYFIQLAATYSSKGDESRALAVLELADQQGFLDQEREILQLVQRYMYNDLPWPAARSLQRGLDAGTVEPTSKNLEMLASAYLAAREYDKALQPLAKAAELAEDGNLYVRLAQVYLEVEDWTSARKALDQAIAKGGLKNPGNAHLLRGISNFNDDRLDSARKAFNDALADEDTAENARKWIEVVDRAERERAQL
jgi:tetratricopeptide (TPR) repeat protein